MNSTPIALATTLENRTSALTKDAKLLNAFVDVKQSGRMYVCKRPGHTLEEAYPSAGTAQGMTSYGVSIFAVINDVFYTTPTTGINIVAGNQPIEFANTASSFLVGILVDNPDLMFKIDNYAWVYNADTVGTAQAVTSITQSFSVATVTQTAHGYTTGDFITIAGAGQTAYNGDYEITVTGANTYTYAVSDNPTSPATGTITATATGLAHIVDADYPANTAYGIVYLNGTHYIMTLDGTIYGSDQEDCRSWDALNFISAEIEADSGVAIAKYLNYILAFGEWSTEVFSDVGNPPPASPLARIDNALMLIGCASARSIATTDNSVFWIGQVKEGNYGASAGRSVVQMTGMQYKPVSTPAVDCILGADPLTHVYSYTFKHRGHSFYVLTLPDSNITLVYDITVGLWYSWTSMLAQSPKSVTSLTYSATSGLATATVATHGYADGDVVTIAGAAQTGYNVTTNITYLTANTFSYTPTGAPVTPATGTITSLGYTEKYYDMVYNIAQLGVNYMLSSFSGNLYIMDETTYDDDGVYINFLTRTTNIDKQNNNHKLITRMDIIGDKVTGTALVRYSKDDYQTFSNYRKINLALDRCDISRIGRGRRIAFDIRITDNIPVRLERLDITFNEE